MLADRAKPADFNNDGNADLIWRSRSGDDVQVWLMNGSSTLSTGNLPKLNSSWQYDIGDFDGDNKSDIFWSVQGGGENQIWLMDGDTIKETIVLPRTQGSRFLTWSYDLGDFNGDGKTDIFASGRDTFEQKTEHRIWLIDENGLVENKSLLELPIDWKPKLGNFDNDGKTDIFWQFTRNNSGGETAIWLMDGTTIKSAEYLFNVSSGWSADLADFNGDSQDDLFWRNRFTGQTAIWQIDGTTVSDAQFLPSLQNEWSYQLGDFNNDGKTDFFWHFITPDNPNDSEQTGIWLMDGAKIAEAEFLANVSGGAWKSEVGDFNGDGRTDLFWRTDDINGFNAIWQIDGTELTSGEFLPAYRNNSSINRRFIDTWQTFLFDFNGDGKTDFFWRNIDFQSQENGENIVWLMDGSQISQNAELVTMDASIWDLNKRRYIQVGPATV